MESWQKIIEGAEGFDAELDARFGVQSSAYSAHVERLERDFNVLRSEQSALVEAVVALKAATSDYLARLTTDFMAAEVRADDDEDQRALQVAGILDRLAKLEADSATNQGITEAADIALAGYLAAGSAAHEDLAQRVGQLEGLVRLLTGTLAPAQEPLPPPAAPKAAAKARR